MVKKGSHQKPHTRISNKGKSYRAGKGISRKNYNKKYYDKNYEIARNLISNEIEDFENDPKGYVESMGWEYTDEYKRIVEEINYDVDDIEKISNSLSPTSNDLERDVVTNMVAGKIIDEMKYLKPKRD